MWSNAHAGPAAVIDLLAGVFEADSEVLVTDDEDARATTREHVFGGRIAGPHTTSAFRGSGRRPREEQLSWDLRIWVSQPGLTKRENRQRAVALGGRIEEAMAAAEVHDGLGVTGMKTIEITSIAMENYGTDDQPITEIVFTVAFRSILT